MDYVNLIYKVLSGQATETDQEKLRKWLAKAPANKEEYEDIKRVYQADQNFEEREANRDEKFYDDFRNVLVRIDRIKRQRRITRWAITMLTSILITVLIAIGWDQMHQPTTTTTATKDAVSIQLATDLVFEEVTILEIFETLESDYQVTIQASNKNLLACRFTGTFYRGTSIKDMVHAVAQAEDFRLSAKGLQMEIHGEGCPE